MNLNNNRADVYTIVPREGQKNFWLKIGTAFANKDGSLNVYLNALPLTGELNIRESKAKETADAQ